MFTQKMVVGSAQWSNVPEGIAPDLNHLAGVRDDAHAGGHLGRHDAATPSMAQRPWITSNYASHWGLTNPPAPSGSDMPEVEAEVAGEAAVQVGHVLVETPIG